MLLWLYIFSISILTLFLIQCHYSTHVLATNEHNADKMADDRMRILEEHNYALNLKFKPGLYRCECNKYSTDVRQHFYTHRTEHCKKNEHKQKRNESCMICEKMFTRNGLRDHYRNYTDPNRIPRGIHAKYSIQHHLNLLKKMSKKRN